MVVSGVDWADEEEVKSYLEHISVEYRFGCYIEKNPISCHLLGDYFEGVKADHEKAGRVYRNNCEQLNHPRSCFKIANYSFLGKGVPQNVADASKYYAVGCDLGEAESCLFGGLMHIMDNAPAPPNYPKQHKPRDYDKGLKFLDKACALKNAEACYHISALFIQGVKDVFDKNMEKAFEYSLQACALGNRFGCANVAEMYRRGEGVEKDEGKWEEFKKRTLELQAAAKPIIQN